MTEYGTGSTTVGYGNKGRHIKRPHPWRVDEARRQTRDTPPAEGGTDA